MSTKFVKKIFSAVMVAVFVLSTAVVPMELTETTVYAATATVDVTNGRCIYTNAQGQELQLSRSLVTKDALIASDTTVYMQWANGSLYFYSPQYSKGNTITFLADGVTAISPSGYETTRGHKNYPTESEIKSKLGLDGNSNGNNGNGGNSNGNNGNSNNNQNQSPTIGAYKLDSTTVLYNDGTSTYVLSQKEPVDDVVTQKNVVYIRYINGDIKKWNVATKGQTVVLTTIATVTKGFAKDNNGQVTGYYDNTGAVKSLTDTTPTTPANTISYYVAIATDKKSVTVASWQNANTFSGMYTVTIPETETIDWSYADKNGIIYIKATSGNLYIFYLELQKPVTGTAVKTSVKIATNVTTPVVTGNQIIGYLMVGNSAMQNVLTVNEAKIAIAMAASNNGSTTTPTNTTDDTSSKVTLDRVITKNTYKMLYNSNNKEVTRLRLRKKVLTLEGKKITKVSKADFTKSGNVVYIKGSKAYLIDKTTLASKLIMSKNAKCFAHSNKGFAKSIVRKDGTKKTITG